MCEGELGGGMSREGWGWEHGIGYMGWTGGALALRIANTERAWRCFGGIGLRFGTSS